MDVKRRIRPPLLSDAKVEKGGPARASKLTPEQRSASARKAVQARWAKKANEGIDPIVLPRKDLAGEKSGALHKEEMSETASAPTVLGTSKKALHLCLKHIKEAKSDSELRRLTEELQQIVFHRQYRNAEN